MVPFDEECESRNGLGEDVVELAEDVWTMVEELFDQK